MSCSHGKLQNLVHHSQKVADPPSGQEDLRYAGNLHNILPVVAYFLDNQEFFYTWMELFHKHEHVMPDLLKLYL